MLAFSKVMKEKCRLILTVVLVLLCAWVYLADFEAKKANQWYQSGAQALAAPYVELESWIKSNTNVNGVFITTNEDAFMMNALTGRKVLSYRRSHSSPYTDVNSRMADQAVIVYGNDAAEAQALLKNRSVKYLLWSARWILNEFNFDAQGQLTGFFDPLDVPDNSTNRKYWDSNGVQFLNQTMPLDPAPRTGVPSYAVLIAIPYKLDTETPFNPKLIDGFTLVKKIQYQGQDYFRVYERKP